jgi:hypothetical protein
VSEIDLRFFLDGDAPEPLVPVDAVPADAVPLAAKLERVASNALDKLDEVLGIPLPDPSDPSFGNLSRAQSAAANTAINAQLRVDETALRARQTDMMPRLLEILAREERKLATRCEEQVSKVERVHGEK